MEDNSVYFVEWKEEYVSQERGSRIVHYILKDSCGKSILAVVGTERSLRHMVYVVAEDFLSYSGSDNPIQAGFKWRSRREVVDWLTSMLAKQHQADSPSGDSTQSLGSSELLNAKNCSADKMDRRVRNLKQSYSDVMWLGAAWNCGKQLKHFPAFCRNGTTIGVQSFVFVMAKEGNRYVGLFGGYV
ncbi:Cysteine--tRNA ligase [Bienertia sinuspersici]